MQKINCSISQREIIFHNVYKFVDYQKVHKFGFQGFSLKLTHWLPGVKTGVKTGFSTNFSRLTHPGEMT